MREAISGFTTWTFLKGWELRIMVHSRVARLSVMPPIGLLLTAVGALKIGFGALLLFELFYSYK